MTERGKGIKKRKKCMTGRIPLCVISRFVISCKFVYVLRAKRTKTSHPSVSHFCDELLPVILS
jgi:hypothetical protein